ncbi:MAG: hypothetical protein IKA12_04205 [Clostridia bacterium]|nr:hypothetical protein [Clostridia bacterium]
MLVKQVATFVNDAISQVVGEEATLLTEDLSNVVAVGTAVFNATSYDKFTKALVDRIGKTIFVDRKYEGIAPSVIYDGFEYGAVLEKIGGDIPEATENETWDLVGGQSYDPNVFYAPSVYAKFYNHYITFEIPLSVTDKQAKSAFSNAQELTRFVSMLFGNVDKALSLAMESLVMRTINGAVAETIYASYGSADYGASSKVKARNLLQEWNAKLGQGNEITMKAALEDKDFIRFASVEIMKVATRLKKMSTLFNVGGKKRFTPMDKLKIVLHGDFEAAATGYLYSDTFHEDYVKLPKADIVPFWQGSGDDYDFEVSSEIKVNLPSDATKTVDVKGVIGVLFDEEALGVLNFERYTTSDYNGKAEFTNYWHKQKSCHFIDMNENIVVFFLQEEAGE